MSEWDLWLKVSVKRKMGVGSMRVRNLVGNGGVWKGGMRRRSGVMRRKRVRTGAAEVEEMSVLMRAATVERAKKKHTMRADGHMCSDAPVEASSRKFKGNGGGHERLAKKKARGEKKEEEDTSFAFIDRRHGRKGEAGEKRAVTTSMTELTSAAASTTMQSSSASSVVQQSARHEHPAAARNDDERAQEHLENGAAGLHRRRVGAERDVLRRQRRRIDGSSRSSKRIWTSEATGGFRALHSFPHGKFRELKLCNGRIDAVRNVMNDEHVLSWFMCATPKDINNLLTSLGDDPEGWYVRLSRTVPSLTHTHTHFSSYSLHMPYRLSRLGLTVFPYFFVLAILIHGFRVHTYAYRPHVTTSSLSYVVVSASAECCAVRHESTVTTD